MPHRPLSQRRLAEQRSQISGWCYTAHRSFHLIWPAASCAAANGKCVALVPSSVLGIDGEHDVTSVRCMRIVAVRPHTMLIHRKCRVAAESGTCIAVAAGGCDSPSPGAAQRGGAPAQTSAPGLPPAGCRSGRTPLAAAGKGPPPPQETCQGCSTGRFGLQFQWVRVARVGSKSSGCKRHSRASFETR